LTEDLVEQIDDGYDGSDLPARFKAAIRFADALISDPGSMPGPSRHDLRSELLGELSPAEIVELAVTVTVAMGASKMAIAWGPPPPMPVSEVPTPTPDSTVA
jgi:hypothetical protein